MMAVLKDISKEDFDKVVHRRRPKKDLIKFIEDFVENGSEVAEVLFEEHEYKSPKVAYSCLKICVKRSFKGRLSIKQRDGKIYMVKN